MNEGISLEEFAERYGTGALKDRMNVIERLKEEGLLEEIERMLRFTEKGRDISNYVLMELI